MNEIAVYIPVPESVLMWQRVEGALGRIGLASYVIIVVLLACQTIRWIRQRRKKQPARFWTRRMIIAIAVLAIFSIANLVFSITIYEMGWSRYNPPLPDCASDSYHPCMVPDTQ
jgi:hypothetical protein